MKPASQPPASRTGTETDVAVRLYLTSVVAMREQVAAWRRGELPALHPMKRIAQAVAAGASNAAYPMVVALASGPRDDASRAVQTAMLGTSAARRGTRDARALRHLALAALLTDAGRARLAGVTSVDLDVFQQLPDAVDALAPASSAALGMTGTLTPAVEDSSVTAFEVAWLERPRLGPLYGGQLQPRLASRVIVTVRAFLELVAPRSGASPLSPFDALVKLAGAPPAGSQALQLLAKAIGLLPVGTVLELESGEWAVVAPGAGSSGQPLIRVLTERGGKPLDRTALVDLGTATADLRPVRVIPPEQARFNPVRAFLGNLGA